MTKTWKLVLGTVVLSLIAFAVGYGGGSPAAPPAAREPAVTVDELHADLASYLYPGFVDASWYSLIDFEKTHVRVNNEHEFFIDVYTDIYPDSDAASPAFGISAAFKGWALGVEREHQLELQNLTVFGVRGGVPVRLREWSILWGWR